MCHQPIKLETNASQLSFRQKVIQNMGLKSDWVPEELFNALAWPDCPCTCFEANNTSCGTKTASTPLLVCMETYPLGVLEIVENSICRNFLTPSQISVHNET